MQSTNMMKMKNRLSLPNASLVASALFLVTGCKSAAVEQGSPIVGGSGTGSTAGVAAPASGSAAVTATAGKSAVPPVGGTTTAGSGPAAGSGSGAAPAAGSSGSKPVGGKSEWRMIAYDLASTYNNSAETVLNKDNAKSLDIGWRKDLGTNIYGAPLQIGDTLYASTGNAVFAFNADSGEPIWRNTTIGTTGSLAFDNDMLYLHTTGAQLVALTASAGEQKWSKPVCPGQMGDGSSSPIIAGDLVLIGGSAGGAEVSGASTYRGNVSALNKTTGEIAWTTYNVPTGSTGASLWSSVAVDIEVGRIFGGTGNNHTTPATDTSDSIIAYNLKTGAIEWKNQRTMGDTWNLISGAASPDADFGANPVLYEAPVGGVMTQLVAGGQKAGAAHGLRRADGMQVWTRMLCPGAKDGQQGIFANATWSGKDMLFACNGGGKSTLYALNGGTGDVTWMLALPGEVYGRISAITGVAFIGSGANLVVVDTDTGAIIKTIPSMGGTVAGTISIANGRVAYGEGLTWANGVAGSTLTVLKVK